MKKFNQNIKNHKVIVSSVLAVMLVAVIGVGGYFGVNALNKQQVKEKAISALNNKTEMTADEVAEIATGEEIVKDNGETVVVTQDESGNIVETIVKDKNGNSTGASVPQNYNNNARTNNGNNNANNNSSGGNYSPKPAPQGHSHTWVAHTATRQVITGYTQEQGHNEPIYTKQGYDACNECGGELFGEELHRHNGHLAGCGVAYRQVQTGTRYVVDVAGGQPIYGTETYTDYYYCSGCGARQ